MDRQDRKAAIAAYKERAPAYGVYAVIRTATGEAWFGASRHVDTQLNSPWFPLRQGSRLFASIPAAWARHGEDAFRFEDLERLRPDFFELGRMDELKRRQALWRDRLQASAL